MFCPVALLDVREIERHAAIATLLKRQAIEAIAVLPTSVAVTSFSMKIQKAEPVRDDH
jgi:hypothetical protein